MKIRIIGSIVCVVVISIIGWIVYDEISDNGGEGGKELVEKVELDSLNGVFKDKYCDKIKKFNIYFEASKSMDGYISGITDFESMTQQVVGTIISRNMEKDGSVSCNYIVDNKFVQIDTLYKPFFDKFKEDKCAFEEYGKLDRRRSNLTKAIETIIDITGKDSVSMFVSDCVFSPMSDVKVFKLLGVLTTDMMNILKKKLDENPDFSVMIYRLESDFTGSYYNTKDTPIQLTDTKRPYFIWFFGNTNHLADIRKELESVVVKDGQDPYVESRGYSHVPYYISTSAGGWYFNPKATKMDKGQTIGAKIPLDVDFSKVPYSSDYLSNKDNYKVSNPKKFEIRDVLAQSNESKNWSSYNYRLESVIKGGQNGNLMPHEEIEISLLKPKDMPEWVLKYDDRIGTAYDNTSKTDTVTPRTFGIGSLLEGVKKAYGDSDRSTFVTMKIIINYKK